MNKPEPRTWRFVNGYGEAWEFTYDPIRKEGLLRGSDVDWQAYPVLGGQVLNLLLNEEEIQWLRKVWKEATTDV